MLEFSKNLVKSQYFTIASSRAMEFKEKIKKACRGKNLILFCLVLLFLWWGSNAVVRYWSQHLTTDISYKSIHSLHNGDTNPGVQLPLITICHSLGFYKDPIIKECDDGSWDFVNIVTFCMKRNKNSKEANLMQNLHSEIGNIVEMVQFWTGSMYVNLRHFDKKVWTRVFLPAFGPCYTFDLSKVETLKHISFETGKRFGIEFVMAEKHLWQTTELILHTSVDLPDAPLFNGFSTLSFSDQIKQAHTVDIRKKINKRESTRKVPCVKYEYLTCRSIEDNVLIFERFHCIIPILYTGQHLHDVIPKDASYCNYEVALEALDFTSEKESNCSMAQTCENVRFTSNHKAVETWLENRTLVYVVFENPEVEYQHSYISYDLISLIGEVGGILGLTLGASVLTLFESLFKHIPYY